MTVHTLDLSDETHRAIEQARKEWLARQARVKWLNEEAARLAVSREWGWEDIYVELAKEEDNRQLMTEAIARAAVFGREK
jgi:hypothetical protein